MIAVKSHEMQTLEAVAIDQFEIPGIILMENAARSFVEEFSKEQDIYHSHIFVFCGTGNNGGDGFAIARHLHGKKYKVQVVLVGEVERMKGNASTNYQILTHLKLPVVQVISEVELENVLTKVEKNTIVIDALFGTGCHHRIEGLYAKTIAALNELKLKVYSVDMPSGVDADNGEILGIAIRAFKTITFCLPKVGLFLYPGALHTGEVIVVDIGIPEQVWLHTDFKYEIIEDSYKKLIPTREIISHKGTYGKVLIIAGSRTMMGAACLSALAAYKTGCGLVKVVTEKGREDVLFQAVPEAIVETYVKDNENFDNELIKIENAIKWSDAVLIGPGMGDDDFTYRIIERALKSEEHRIIIDADGLNALSKNLNLLKDRKGKIIITPHIGEMSRLTGCSSQELLAHTIDYAIDFSQKYKVITVLKSARTIIVNDESVFINVLGNNGMATAGSGDVLAGVMVSLLAQAPYKLQAVTLGVYVHSKAGDLASEKLGQHSMMASDIIDSISAVMR